MVLGQLVDRFIEMFAAVVCHEEYHRLVFVLLENAVKRMRWIGVVVENKYGLVGSYNIAEAVEIGYSVHDYMRVLIFTDGITCHRCMGFTHIETLLC